MNFKWDEIQRKPDGKMLLLYRHQRVIDEGLFHEGHDVLDVGGWGVFAQAVIEEGANATILDLFTADQYYPDRVRELPHVVGDVLDRSNFAEGSFDLVTCFETLEHVGSILRAVENMYLWLRLGGHIAGTVPRKGYCHLENEAGITFVSEEELGKILEAVGFAQVIVEPSGSLASDSAQSCLYFKGIKLLQPEAVPAPFQPPQPIDLPKPKKKPGPKAKAKP